LFKYKGAHLLISPLKSLGASQIAFKFRYTTRRDRRRTPIFKGRARGASHPTGILTWDYAIIQDAHNRQFDSLPHQVHQHRIVLQ
jgi:hypothetical protein